MTSDHETLSRIGSWMEDGRTRLPDHVLDAVLDQLSATPQSRPRWSPWGTPTVASRARLSLTALAVVTIALVGLTLVRQPVVGPAPSPSASSSPSASASASATPTMPEPSAGLASPGPISAVTPCKMPSTAAGVLLGCSRDATRLLIKKDDANLFVLQADGSETQVTEQLSKFNAMPQTTWPSGATISPDGSRVVYASVTKAPRDAVFCHDGALFTVNADGGPATLLWKSQIPQNGWLTYPAFSPDGTRIAFDDGYCDWGHTVWVMNADGTDAHQIVPSDSFGATHVHGVEWSKAGDRIALVVDDGVYAFAPDGSGFGRLVKGSDFCFLAPSC